MSKTSTPDPTQLARLRQLLATGEARAIRRAARCSMAEIASHLGTDESMISRYERGERVPGARVAIEYLALLRRLDRIARRGREAERDEGS
jgi:transcriptional regulator with XRE-family HTH domain